MSRNTTNTPTNTTMTTAATPTPTPTAAAASSAKTDTTAARDGAAISSSAKARASKASAKKTAGKKAPAAPRLSRQRRPTAMPVDDWQRALRQQFGSEQDFGLENLGAEPVFSDFRVSNPASRSTYRVSIRGAQPGDNLCACADFATNDLGTCKHIEFTLARISSKRGGKAALARGFTPPFSEVYLHYGAQRSLRFRAGAECPADVLHQARELFDAPAGWVLPWAKLSALDDFIGLAKNSAHELRVSDAALAFAAQIRDVEGREKALATAYPDGANDKALAKLLKAQLYTYQCEGALFAARVGRVLIGDEMGLGKTVQAIAAAELMARHFGVQRVLVVCPTSLKHQWQREITRFSERQAQVIQGLRAARALQYREDIFCNITNYDTLARDADLIDDWGPELLIVDEAQRIKNWNTIAARAIKRINAPHVIVLTGTPLENRLQELISIVQLVDQHRLGPTWRLLHDHQQVDDVGRVIGYRDLDRIGNSLKPIMLRRRKSEVLTQLPDRVDNTLFVPMTPQQRVHHDDNRDIVVRIVKRWRKTGFLSDTDQLRLRCALQNMRMSCNSTWLLDHETDFGHKVDELMTLLDELFEDPQAKAVVFSQWLGTHELIVRRLQQRGWGHVLFNGSVPSDKRGALVDRFNSDPDCRLFLSTDAGGVGLNLQHAAATVVNMDLPWNPAVLEQRIGRVHRMGQRRGVQVINLVAQGSIEQGMLGVLAFKKSLFAGVLDGGDSAVFMNGTRLTKFMESVDQVTGGMGLAEEAVADVAPPAGPASPAAAFADGFSAAGLDEQELSTAAPPQAVSVTQSAVLAIAAAPLEAQEAQASAPYRDTARGAPPAAPSAADVWAPLLDAGLKFVAGLSAGAGAGRGASSWVETDAASGRQFLRLPLPEPAALQGLVQGLSKLLADLTRQPPA